MNGIHDRENGAGGHRSRCLLHAKQALYRLSYGPCDDDQFWIWQKYIKMQQFLHVCSNSWWLCITQLGWASNILWRWMMLSYLIVYLSMIVWWLIVSHSTIYSDVANCFFQQPKLQIECIDKTSALIKLSFYHICRAVSFNSGSMSVFFLRDWIYWLKEDSHSDCRVSDWIEPSQCVAFHHECRRVALFYHGVISFLFV